MCHAVCHLLCGSLPSKRTIRLWNTRFPEIFLCDDICGDLAPLLWNLNIVHFKNNLSAGVADHRSAVVIVKHFIDSYLV